MIKNKLKQRIHLNKKTFEKEIFIKFNFLIKFFKHKK